MGFIIFAILLPLWPLLVPHLNGNIGFIWFYFLVFLAGGMLAAIPFESLWTWLFPRFEYGKNSSSKRARNFIWGLLVGSGFISALILKLLGL